MIHRLYTGGIAKLPATVLWIVSASSVVSTSGIDMPPEMTISVARKKVETEQLDELMSNLFEVIGKIKLPMPSRTERLGLMMSFELMRKMSPR